MRKNARNDLGLFDASNNPELSAAAGTAFDLDPEHPLEQSRPVHRHVWRRGLLCLALRICALHCSQAALCWHQPRTHQGAHAL
jgi:hypothetical protein